MDHETFKSIITQMQEDSLATLLEKNSGYSNADPLHNFHQAAKLKGETTFKAIGGMMAKHTVSIYDLINKASEEYVPEEVWFEKIQDHMNYLLFLWAAVEETEINQNSFVVNAEKPDLNSDEALKELREKLTRPSSVPVDEDGVPWDHGTGSFEDLAIETYEYKDEPNSKKSDLAELRRKLIFTEDEPKDEPKDDWVAPKNVMINKEI